MFLSLLFVLPFFSSMSLVKHAKTPHVQLYTASVNSTMAPANSDGPPKGDGYMAPHILAMSATPIPRTLALALYGDMSLTQVCEACSFYNCKQTLYK